MSNFNKVVLGIVCFFIATFLTQWLFNHFNPYVGILFGAAAIYFGTSIILKEIKKHENS